jgi:histidine ammonia-lyase
MSSAAALEHFRPLKSTPALEAVHALVRSVVPPLKVERSMKSLLITKAVFSCIF